MCGRVVWVGGVQWGVRNGYGWKEVITEKAVCFSLLVNDERIHIFHKLFHKAVYFSFKGEWDDIG